MREIDRTTERSGRVSARNPDSSMSGTTIGAKRADAERSLAAIDKHLEKALSGNSRAFLEANRQTGGE